MTTMTKTVKITVETIGQAFGTVGYLRRGRTIVASTDTKPYGNRSAAYSAAQALAAKLGLSVRA